MHRNMFFLQRCALQRRYKAREAFGYLVMSKWYMSCAFELAYSSVPAHMGSS